MGRREKQKEMKYFYFFVGLQQQLRPSLKAKKKKKRTFPLTTVSYLYNRDVSLQQQKKKDLVFLLFYVVLFFFRIQEKKKKEIATTTTILLGFHCLMGQSRKRRHKTISNSTICSPAHIRIGLEEEKKKNERKMSRESF